MGELLQKSVSIKFIDKCMHIYLNPYIHSIKEEGIYILYLKMCTVPLLESCTVVTSQILEETFEKSHLLIGLSKFA